MNAVKLDSLMTLDEIAEALKLNVNHVRDRLVKESTFPRPVINRPRKGLLWQRKDVEAWLATAPDSAPLGRPYISRKQQIPPWADMDAIKGVYAEAVRRTMETGVLHHVDHVVPLRGRRVSGLHVAENLQVIPWADNLRKNNRYEIV